MPGCVCGGVSAVLPAPAVKSPNVSLSLWSLSLLFLGSSVSLAPTASWVLSSAAPLRQAPPQPRPPGSAGVQKALAAGRPGSVRSGPRRDGERSPPSRRAAAEPSQRTGSPGSPATGAGRRSGRDPDPGSGGGRGGTPLPLKDVGELRVLHARLLQKGVPDSLTGGGGQGTLGLGPRSGTHYQRRAKSLTWGLLADAISWFWRRELGDPLTPDSWTDRG